MNILEGEIELGKKVINKKDKMKMIYIPSQTYEMGSSTDIGHKVDKEGPKELITIENFYISETTVTNKQFMEFVNKTGYITQAEKRGSSYVFYQLINKKYRDTVQYKNTGTPWWLDVIGASWKHPEGPNSSIIDRMNHPVVHISWYDAIKYSKWADGRLPSEAEWEASARANEKGKIFPWGDELVSKGVYNANTWQGDFPSDNSKKDGYLGTAPVKEFYKDKNGIYQMIGNVWEWCLNSGQIPLKVFKDKSAKDFNKENSVKPYDLYALRGGSFLCHYSYCNRYRIAGRNSATPMSSASNLGFRYIVDGI